MSKKILVVSRHAPYGKSSARDALDCVLAAAVYDQAISLLFMNDGIFQLLPNQNGQNIAQKNVDSIISALQFYDIEHVYVHQESLEQRQIAVDELAIGNIKVLTNTQVAALFNEQDHILSF